MLTTDLALLLQETAAPADPAGGAAPSGFSGLSGMLIPGLLMFLVFYVFIIGPDRKQRKKREQMLASLQKGAKVMTTGGLYGIVNQVQDQIVTLQVADGVRLRFATSAIQQVIEETSEPAKS